MSTPEVYPSSHIYICSFPRSGNTWLRLLLSDIILQRHGFDTSGALPISPNAVIPDVHVHGPDAKPDPRIFLPSPLLKSHLPYHTHPFKSVYLFRLPVDSLVSFYHFHLRYPDKAATVQSGIDAFCLGQLKKWCAHTESFLAAIESQGTVLFTCYEALTADTPGTLAKIASFLEIETSQDACEAAAANQKFEKKQASEKLTGDLLVPFYRRGEVGGGASEIRPDTLAEIEAATMPLYHQALHVMALQELGWSRTAVSTWLHHSKKGAPPTDPTKRAQHELATLKRSLAWRLAGKPFFSIEKRVKRLLSPPPAPK